MEKKPIGSWRRMSKMTGTEQRSIKDSVLWCKCLACAHPLDQKANSTPASQG